MSDGLHKHLVFILCASSRSLRDDESTARTSPVTPYFASDDLVLGMAHKSCSQPSLVMAVAACLHSHLMLRYKVESQKASRRYDFQQRWYLVFGSLAV